MRRTQGSGEQLQRIDKAELPPRWASFALICIRAVAAFAFAIAVSVAVAMIITKPLPSHLTIFRHMHSHNPHIAQDFLYQVPNLFFIIHDEDT